MARREEPTRAQQFTFRKQRQECSALVIRDFQREKHEATATAALGRQFPASDRRKGNTRA
jgi:hypothetical protein